MKDRDLIKWLKNNSSGAYRPAEEAAFRMEQMRCALMEISEMDCDYSLLYAKRAGSNCFIR